MTLAKILEGTPRAHSWKRPGEVSSYSSSRKDVRFYLDTDLVSWLKERADEVGTSTSRVLESIVRSVKEGA